MIRVEVVQGVDGRTWTVDSCECAGCVLGSGPPAYERPVHGPVSATPTPWAVHCWRHGDERQLVYLTSHEYRRQLCRPGLSWECPVGLDCGGGWSDDNYEDYLEALERQERAT